MRHNPIVLMIQTYGDTWDIVSYKGHIIQKGIRAGTLPEAEAYVKAYVSSYDGWWYEMRPKIKNPEKD